jgi:hypothetical protein
VWIGVQARIADELLSHALAKGSRLGLGKLVCLLALHSRKPLTISRIAGFGGKDEADEKKPSGKNDSKKDKEPSQTEGKTESKEKRDRHGDKDKDRDKDKRDDRKRRRSPSEGKSTAR